MAPDGSAAAEGTERTSPAHVDPQRDDDSSCSDESSFASVHSRPQHQRPCIALSIYLRRTMVNAQRDRLRRSPRFRNRGYDDEHGNYVVIPGEHIHGNYLDFEVVGVIGKGSFGTVVKAFNVEGDAFALKIVRNKSIFAAQARVEVKLLRLMQQSRREADNIIDLLQDFEFAGHHVLVFELLSVNLFELLKMTKMCGLSLQAVRKIAYQLLCTLHFLRRVGIIHCDIKPENILLRNPKRSHIKVIDFGSACAQGRQEYVYIQTRFYRCPEVILHHPYSYEIDMWSVGCVLYEMHTGSPLMDGRGEIEQLHRMQAVLGDFPEDMLEQTHPRRREKIFLPGTFDFVDPPSLQTGKWKRTRRTSLRECLRVDGGGPPQHRGRPGHTQERCELFLGLLSGILQFRPSARLKPDQALQHRFILMPFPEDSQAQADSRQEREGSERPKDARQDPRADEKGAQGPAPEAAAPAAAAPPSPGAEPKAATEADHTTSARR
eukprot:TRINITY_DN2272_c0_g1_i1.p1 TRINITY_DN2272_c0_g1~~TRINITY_DN2272_c0_g1_i1.p1  ORF type:complete len:491 (+),score=120.46 TRINITY_DN2272_c0_g1_i1:106-1578(+)